jgi:hypothetical protein
MKVTAVRSTEYINELERGRQAQERRRHMLKLADQSEAAKARLALVQQSQINTIAIMWAILFGVIALGLAFYTGRLVEFHAHRHSIAAVDQAVEAGEFLAMLPMSKNIGE